MLKLQFSIVLFCIVTLGRTGPVNNILGMEEDVGEFVEERQLEEEIEEDESEVDPRLTKQYPDTSIGPYECATDEQCTNGGTCVDTGEAGKLCNCSHGYLGPFCDYSAASIDRALRVHDIFKVSFADCMTRAGHAAGIHAISLFTKCGGGQNLCWLEEGGVKGLKSLFWCLTNSMRLSLTEAKPEESRLQLYADVFQKLARERQLPDKKNQPKPRAVPIASFQINLYDTSGSNYPFPHHDPIGLPKNDDVRPTWTLWNHDFTSDPNIPPPNGPYDSPYSDKGKGPEPLKDENLGFPKSHEIPTLPPSDDEMGPVDEGGHPPFPWRNFESTEEMQPFPSGLPDYGTGNLMEEENQFPPSDNFLNDALHDFMTDFEYTVVEGDGDVDNNIITSYEEPNIDPNSNMRS